MAMGKILVTGGAGFIGSHIVDSYIEDGYDVTVIDNLSSGKRENVNPQAAFKEWDITKGLRDFCEGVEVIHHVAALPRVGFSVDYPVESNHANITGTVQVLEAAHKAGVKRVVYSASSSAYGNAQYFPTPETRASNVRSPYALQKRVGEEYCRLFSELKGLDTVSLRYFNVFGPRSTRESQYSAVIPIFIEQILKGGPITIEGDGLQSRDFTYVDNVVLANRLAAKHMGQLEGIVLNVGCESTHTIAEIASQLQLLLQKEAPVEYLPSRPGDVQKTQACLDRIRVVLDYEPIVDLGQGLDKTVRWYLQYLGKTIKNG